MMINCKESAVRSSELRDRRITGLRKLELWYHLLICKFCRIYNRQLKMLGRICRLLSDASYGFCDTIDEKSDVKLTEETKERIKEKLRTG